MMIHNQSTAITCASKNTYNSSSDKVTNVEIVCWVVMKLYHNLMAIAIICRNITEEKNCWGLVDKFS